MKNIELTEEHKSKLLEMCKVLFPEYKDISFYSLHDDNGRGFAKEFIYLGNDTKGTGIHWFEFCMTHLINKIRDLLLKQSLINIGSSDSPWQVKQLLSAYYSVNYHPIDYLYEEFKKLK